MGDTTLLTFVGVLTSRLDGDGGGLDQYVADGKNLSA